MILKTPSYFYIFFILSILLTGQIFSERNLLEEKEDELSDDIVIIHTNDVHCAIEDSIGYDGLMLYKKELQTKYKHVLLVDAGDHIQGGSIGLLSKGKDLIDIINLIDYDAVTIGNHEFDYGIDQLYNLSKMINTGYICANFCYRKNQTTIFDPYKIVQVGDISIGFIGVLTPQTLTKTYLHNLVDDDGDLIYDFLTEQKGQQLYDRVQMFIDILRKEKKVKYVIILAHLGNGGDALEQYTSKALLENINGVDAIIDGHSHKVYNYTRKDKDENDIIISQTGTKLTHVGKITIKTSGEITSEMLDEIPLFDGYNDYYQMSRDDIIRYVDRDMYMKLEEIIESHSHEFNQVIGYSDFDLIIYSNHSKDSSSQTSRFEENALCDLIADAIRYIGDGDITMINAGTIREDLHKGNITYNNILDILPFSADIVIKEVSGKDILDALEYGMKSLPDKTPRFPQVSGIKFKVDQTIESPVIIDDYENFVKVEGERRVYDVYVGEEKLDENKIYKMSFDNYIAEGGDGYSMFNKYETINDTLIVDNEAFRIYIERVLNKKIPYIYNSTQGRIIKKEKDPQPIDSDTDNDTDHDSDYVTDSSYYSDSVSDTDRGNNSGYLIKFLGRSFIVLFCLMF